MHFEGSCREAFPHSIHAISNRSTHCSIVSASSNANSAKLVKTAWNPKRCHEKSIPTRRRSTKVVPGNMPMEEGETFLRDSAVVNDIRDRKQEFTHRACQGNQWQNECSWHWQKVPPSEQRCSVTKEDKA
jgi:hypothetical protein